MSAAEHQSPNSSSQSAKSSLRKPPQRPSLVKPPSRPAEPVQEATVPVATPAESSSPETVGSPSVTKSIATASTLIEEAPKPVPALHPISLPSEPMQYRAIGLVRGVYTPEEEQLNRGNLIADDGTKIDSVLLGRVTSLIKKHIDLEASHLWVVYPRTRQMDEEKEGEAADAETDLHLQIVGVWEPETLGMPGENPGAEEEDAEDDDNDAVTAEPAEDESEASVPQAEVEVSGEPTVLSEEVVADLSEEAVTESEDVAVTVEEPDSDASESGEVPVALVDAASALEADVPVEEPSEDEDVTASQADVDLSSEVVDEAQEKPEASELPSENYFSIRGEILKCDEAASQILVKILQGAKQPNKSQKAFKLHVAGQISGKTVGYFWELDVERQGKQLVLLEGRTIGIVPPKKKKKWKKRGPGGSGGGRRPSNQGPRRRRSAPQAKEKPRIRPSAPVKSNPL